MFRFGLNRLLVVAISCGAILQTSESVAQTADAGMTWRVVHEKLEQAGDLIAQHELDQAIARLQQLEEELPEPYRAIPRKVHQKFREKFDQIDAIKRGSDPFGPDDPNELLNDAAMVRLCQDLRANRAAAQLFQAAFEANPPRGDDRHNPSIGPRFLDCLINLDADLERLQCAFDSLDVDHPEVQSLCRARLAAERELRKGKHDAGFLAKVLRLRDPFYRLRLLQRLITETRDEKHRLFCFEESARTLHELGDLAGRDAWESRILHEFGSNSFAAEAVLANRCSRAQTDEEFDLALAAYRAHSPRLSEPDDSCALQILRRINELTYQERWEKAVELDRLILEQFPDSLHANDAQFDLATSLHSLGKFREAATEYEKVLKIERGELEVVDGATGVFLDIWSDRFNDAARGLAECHEALGNLDLAVKWAIVRRDQYPILSFCANAHWGEDRAASAEVVRLMFKADRTNEAVPLCEEAMLQRFNRGGREWNEVYAMLVDHYREHGSLLELESKMTEAMRASRVGHLSCWRN